MISRWEMGLIFAAVALVAAAAFATSPYGHALITGQCRQDNPPAVCDRGMGRMLPRAALPH
jgi:hypothetical protein